MSVLFVNRWWFSKPTFEYSSLLLWLTNSETSIEISTVPVRGGNYSWNSDCTRAVKIPSPLSSPPRPPSLTHANVWYIKLPMCLFYIGLVRSGFVGGKSITRAILGGGGRAKNIDFFGPNGTRYARSHFRAQKVSISWPTPSNATRYGLLPHPNSYFPPHINNRYIYS